MKKYFLWFILIACLNTGLSAAELTVAVASNFKPVLQVLAVDFKTVTGYDLSISSASSGKLFAKIMQGAPFDVFLSAEEKRADLLISNNIASAASAYVYAIGKLVLITNITTSSHCMDVLHMPGLRYLAIANPKIAPYGLAAKQVLESHKLWRRLQPRLVQAENILQAFQFVSTGNADAGFVSRSILDMALLKKGHLIQFACVWDVPVEFYSPINQKMVVLNKAKNKRAVQTFARYMKSQRAKEIIINTGYDVL